LLKLKESVDALPGFASPDLPNDNPEN